MTSVSQKSNQETKVNHKQMEEINLERALYHSESQTVIVSTNLESDCVIMSIDLGSHMRKAAGLFCSLSFQLILY